MWMKSSNLKHNRCFSTVKLPAGLFCWSLLILPWSASSWLQAVPLGLGTTLPLALVSFSETGNTAKNSSFPTGFWNMPMTHNGEVWAKSRFNLDSSFCALLLWAMTADGPQQCGLFPLPPHHWSSGGPEIILWVRDTFSSHQIMHRADCTPKAGYTGKRFYENRQSVISF